MAVRKQWRSVSNVVRAISDNQQEGRFRFRKSVYATLFEHEQRKMGNAVQAEETLGCAMVVQSRLTTMSIVFKSGRDSIAAPADRILLSS
jgi:hypothetical protein